MSYQVLARKWRPQTFADVVGQKHVLDALVNGLSLGRMHHAYLFSGTRGVGKTTIARLLAKGLNCEAGITGAPCGQCTNCREIEHGRFVDLIEIDAASRTKVEDTRDLLDNVQYLPARGRFKVYLIDEVHMLSRHSFNALLKTLEEPPAHVKFLLATTDREKLPVTILSRCLQCHLKALDVEEICNQLERVLIAEQIKTDVRALQLLARASDGSMRDALSLTDQAIAMGLGQVSAATVSQMLGTLDDEQPLAIVEALARADGEKVMEQVAQSAARGADWESLLVEMLALLHRIAMLQLLTARVDNQCLALKQRLCELARTCAPEDVQLYYQTLLVGRKDLAYAPDRRMGVEMTLLRALAFHPKAPRAEVQSVPVKMTQAMQSLHSQDVASPLDQCSVRQNCQQPNFADGTTTKLFSVRSQLRQEEASTVKKRKPAEPERTRSERSPLGRSDSPIKRSQQRRAGKIMPETPVKTSDYGCLGSSDSPGEHEKTPELLAKLVLESLNRDVWASEIAQLKLPQLVQQLALNTFKQQKGAGKICLHLRSDQCHLNSDLAQKTLADGISQLYGRQVELSVVVDDNPAERTPLEWRQVIYKEKLAQARQSIVSDPHIQTLRRFFDAELNEDSIRPI
ncbi:DNA polymerase III subunit tau [Serratia symbiotica]|nr:DNA polymerase III subunit tau [Serratia symbiotica]